MSLRVAASYVRHPSLVRYELEKRSRIREVTEFDFRPYQDVPVCAETVVSLTSYGLRLSTAHMAVRSLLMQKTRPSKVLLYLDKSTKREMLPRELLELEDFGLVVKTGYEDLGPHKKYFFAFKEFPESLVITADDDLIYTSDMVESLLKAHEAAPSCVVARRCHLMRFDDEGNFLPYEQWGWEHKDSRPVSRRCLLATGGAGALYPVKVFDTSLLDMEVIRGVAWPVDDIYLKFFELACGVEVAYAPNRQNHPYQFEHVASGGLCDSNVAGGRNDDILVNLMSRYGVDSSYFREKY